MEILGWILQLLLVPLSAPLGIGLINKLKAKMQGRSGASIFQPYRNLRKLFHKDEVISSDASWIFKLSPFIVFGVTIIAAASIPLFSAHLSLPTDDLLFIVYLLALGTFFLALAGMDTGSAFGGFGSSREMALTALAEAGMIFSILPLVILSGTTELTTLVQVIMQQHATIIVPAALSLAAFFAVLLAETKRFPFDNPVTHLELTMVHEAMLLEYSGKRLALMEWAAANKLFIFAALATNLFFPFGLATDGSFASIAIGVGMLLLKLLVIYIAIAIVESLIAKLRFFRLPHVLFVAFIVNLIAIGLVIWLISWLN